MIAIPTSENEFALSSTLCYTINMRMGRPKKPARERKSRLIALRLTPAEQKKVEERARRSRMSLSQFIRVKLGLRGGL
jgi:hypothetical protein